MRVLILSLLCFSGMASCTTADEFEMEDPVWLDEIYKKLMKPGIDLIRSHVRSILKSLQDQSENVKRALDKKLKNLTELLDPFVKVYISLKYDPTKSHEQNVNKAVKSIIKMLGVVKERSNTIIDALVKNLTMQLTSTDQAYLLSNVRQGELSYNTLSNWIWGPIKRKITSIINYYVQLIVQKGNEVKEKIYKRFDYLAPIIAPHIKRILELKEGSEVQIEEIKKQVERIIYKLTEGRLVLQEETKHIVIDLLKHFTEKIAKLIKIDLEEEKQAEEKQAEEKQVEYRASQFLGNNPLEVPEKGPYFLGAIIKSVFAPILDPISHYVRSLLDDLKNKKEAVEGIIEKKVQELTELLEPRFRIFIAVLRDLGVQKESIKARIEYAMQIIIGNIKEISKENMKMLKKVYRILLDKVVANILSRLEQARPEEFSSYGIEEIKDILMRPWISAMTKIMDGNLRKRILEWASNKKKDMKKDIDVLVEKFRPLFIRFVNALGDLEVEAEVALNKMEYVIAKIIERILAAKENRVSKARELAMQIRQKLESIIKNKDTKPYFSFRRDAIAPPIFPDDDELVFPDRLLFPDDEFIGRHTIVPPIFPDIDGDIIRNKAGQQNAGRRSGKAVRRPTIVPPIWEGNN